MRTTLELDDDLLVLARRLAEQQGSTLGRVISDLARKGLEPKEAPRMKNGVPLFPLKKTGKRPNLDLVNRLRDER